MEIQKYEEIKIFKDNLSSFRETSRDTDGQEAGCMTNSEIQVINFDKVKESYISEMKLPNTPCSNDALYIGKDEKIFFVEFKNGVMKKEKIFNVYYKIYDSLLIFNDIVYFPKKTAFVPALVIELKWNQSAEGAVSQIKKKRYPDALLGYGGDMILVGIAYGKAENGSGRTHTCKIERVRLE